MVRGLLAFVGNGLALSIEADIALATVFRGLFPKVFEQHAAATLIVAARILQHGIDAQGILLLAVFVDVGWQHDVFGILTALTVADIWHLLAWNEADEVSL